MSDDTKQHVESAVKNFFADPKIAQSFLDIAVRKKPVGWSKRSNAPYFNEFNGRQMMKVADTMMKSKEDQVFFYHDYPKYSKTTLYLRVNQSLRALIEFCDNENKDYYHWSQMIDVHREKTGIRLGLKPQFKPEGMTEEFKPRAVADKEKQPEWQIKIDEYLNSEITRPLLIDKLMLNPQQMSDIKASLIPVKGILFSVKSSEIRIVKTSS